MPVALQKSWKRPQKAVARRICDVDFELGELCYFECRGRTMWRFSRLLLGFIAIVLPSNCVAQTNLVRIEEHWELAITEADSQTNAPQVMLHFSPFGEDSDFHFELDLNHASLPQYSPGGFQVRAMQGDQLLSEARQLANVRFDAAAETISWIQIAQKQPAGWAFAVGFGTSQSWGSFGGPETIVSIPRVDLDVHYNLRTRSALLA